MGLPKLINCKSLSFIAGDGGVWKTNWKVYGLSFASGHCGLCNEKENKVSLCFLQIAASFSKTYKTFLA